MRWPFPLPGAEPAAGPPDQATAPPEIGFTFRLFHQLAGPDCSSNVLFSPCSVMLCLAMVYDGATGETRSGMQKALELSGLDSAGLARVITRLRSALEADAAGVQLRISNSLWGNPRLPVRPEFAARAREVYGAEVCEIDFAAADAVDRVNAWVREKTAAMIPRMVDHLDPLTLMVALNAIYFKGLWKLPFERSLTEDRPFTTGSGQEKTLPRMRRRGRFRYYEPPGVQAVVLPYQGSRIAMYVLLPARKSSLRKLRDQLNADRWQIWTDQFALRLGSVHLPRFRINSEAQLRTALADLGMERAFDRQRAEFGGIREAPPPVWIDQVLHRALVDVNEEGTEAAAATITFLRATSLRPQSPEAEFEMIVDRPFLFLIRDEVSGNILFLGSVADPSA